MQKNGKITTTTTKVNFRKAYSKMNMQEIEKKLGLTFSQFEKAAVSIRQMLADTKPEIKGLGEEQLERAKEKVFDNTVGLVEGAKYPGKGRAGTLAALIFIPVLAAFQRETGRKLRLLRKTDTISATVVGTKDHKFFLVAEAKKAEIGNVKRQLMLALKEVGDNNPGGVVYGLVTFGDFWQIIRYQREIFTQTDPVQVVFPTMGCDKAKWLKESSIIVDFLDAVLRSEEFVAA